jgi:hypothetical protein
MIFNVHAGQLYMYLQLKHIIHTLGVDVVMGADAIVTNVTIQRKFHTLTSVQLSNQDLMSLVMLEL